MREWVKEKFNKEPDTSVAPEEAIALGADLFAKVVANQDPEASNFMHSLKRLSTLTSIWVEEPGKARSSKAEIIIHRLAVARLRNWRIDDKNSVFVYFRDQMLTDYSKTP